MRDQIKDEAYFEEFFAYEARRIKWANKILDTPQNYVEQAIHNSFDIELIVCAQSKPISVASFVNGIQTLKITYH